MRRTWWGCLGRGGGRSDGRDAEVEGGGREGGREGGGGVALCCTVLVWPSWGWTPTVVTIPHTRVQIVQPRFGGADACRLLGGGALGRWMDLGC